MSNQTPGAILVVVSVARGGGRDEVCCLEPISVVFGNTILFVYTPLKSIGGCFGLFVWAHNGDICLTELVEKVEHE